MQNFLPSSFNTHLQSHPLKRLLCLTPSEGFILWIGSQACISFWTSSLGLSLFSTQIWSRFFWWKTNQKPLISSVQRRRVRHGYWVSLVFKPGAQAQKLMSKVWQINVQGKSLEGNTLSWSIGYFTQHSSWAALCLELWFFFPFSYWCDFNRGMANAWVFH